jgi:hypothetical protein
VPAVRNELNEERIRAVAAMLPPEPVGLGRPIGDRAAWEAMLRHQASKDALSRAERLLDEPLPETTDDLFLEYSRIGDRDRWQGVNRRRRSRLTAFTLAECLEDGGRFLPRLEGAIRSICAERTWVFPAHDGDLKNFRGEAVDIDLFSSATAWDMATLDYLLGDRLSADTRELLRSNVRARVVGPFLDMATGRRPGNWWMYTTNNWNAVCLACVVGATLAQDKSVEERATAVVAAEDLISNFLSGFPPDGYCTEGLGYWNYGFGHFVLLAETLYQATGGGLDLMARPGIADIAMYPLRLEMQDGVWPALADCSVGARPDRKILGYVSRRLGLGLTQCEPDGSVSWPGSLPAALTYSFPNSASVAAPAAHAPEGPGVRSWFGHGGVLICRPRTGGRFAVSIKGGHNDEHHNHNDLGSFVVAVDGRQVLTDAGAEVYTRRTFSDRRYDSKVLNSYGHPVPVVAGCLQRPGRDARAGVVRAEFADDLDVLAFDLSSAYDVPELQRLIRTFTYSRVGEGSLTVTDHVRFASPQTFGTALITFGRWSQAGPNALIVQDGESAVRVELEVEGPGCELSAETIDEDVRTDTKPTRIGINLTAPVTEARLTMHIQTQKA